MMEFKLVIDAKAGIAETPVWDERVDGLYWTDVATGDIHLFMPATGEKQVWHTNKAIGSAIPSDDAGRLFCALDGGLFLFDLSIGRLESICNPDAREGYRYNDSRIDARGRIFTSSVSKLYGTDKYSPDMLGNFYMIDTDGTVTVIAEGVNQYNGIVWNSANTKMFVVDTFNYKLLAFPYDADRGPTGDPECEVDLKDIGMPDGISIDVEDRLYICHWSGKISVWDSQLSQIDIMQFPVEYVCCGGFGGPEMMDFFVASSCFQYTEEDFQKNPGAGGTFAARSGIAGRPDNFFKLSSK